MKLFRSPRFRPQPQRPDRSKASGTGRHFAAPLTRIVAVLGGLVLLVLSGGQDASLSAQCGANPIVCENQKPGDPSSQWQISGSGDGSIQGFATLFSATPSQIQQFKIDTDANNYSIDIYRMGYYSNFGARRVATISPSASLPQSQPNCITVSSTGLVDCGNWAVSASWPIPSTAVSGIYFAKLTRTDTGGSSHIFFIVRDDAGQSDVVFQTADTTWQAYNSYGGNSFYTGGPGVNPGRAYALSYNRPFNTRSGSPEDFVFNAEYPMVRWLERNGFNVSYISGADTDRAPLELREHKIFLSVGHDEYWSGAQRANVEAARAAGVNLAFFSGNEVFWKTRWAASVDGSNTPYKTLISYKETHANAVIDPAHPTWTGTWRDTRFSPPADGGKPENSLTGTIFRVNDGNTTAITVPAADGKHRFWRNTTVATLATGAVATMPNGTLGYEWDDAPQNSSTPSGLMRLSTTTRAVTSMLLDFGSSYGAGTATHNLTLYRHPTNGALVFGAGTIQWSWGLDANHDRGSTAADARMKQATINLFADMQVLPGTLEAGLTPATPSSDVTAPTSIITAPAAGASFPSGTPVTISGTASDAGGGIVGGVEVSTNGGATWAKATGTTSWTYSWSASPVGSVSIRSRAYDDTGNFETPSAGRTVTVTAGQVCPCTIWTASSVPPIVDDGDPAAVEVGTRFRSDVSGYITAIRFYKAPLNTGTHTGRLWTNTGVLLATVTFSGETASGWQQAPLASAVPITANTTYLVSYHAPNGHYTGTDGFFGTTGLDNPPLHGLRDGVDGANGVYRYGSGGVFPTDTYLAEGYWADVVFSTVAPPDSTKPTVTSFFPASGASGVDPAAVVTATFSEAMDPATISSSTTGFVGEGGSSLGTFELRNPLNSLVNATVSYDPTTRVATLDPDASLGLSTTYTATVKGGTVDPRVKDLAGNALAANATWTFTTAAAPPPPPTCPCTIWTPTTVPQKIDDGDPNSVELGTRFRSDVAGYITGARFYKGSLNTGTHIAKLWTNAGVLLGSATFTGETTSGWQETAFTTPIAIAANTTYMMSYHANNGHYSSQPLLFATAGVDRGPLHALRDGVDGANGVYQYGTSVFPTQTFQSEAYFVEPVFNTTIGPDTTPPTVTAVGPIGGISGVGASSNLLATFSENMNAASITTTSFLLRNPSNQLIPASVTYNSSTRTATLDPTAALAYLTTYTAVVKGGATDPRVKDTAGNALASDYTWSFTTAAPPPPPPTQGPGGPVLVVTSAANAFSTYLAEILRTEGLNAFTVADLATVTAGTLANYDLVILGEMPLSAAQVSMFTTWVTQGGNLVAMRPDKQLAGLMGLTDASATLANAYLLVNTATAPGAGIVNQTMQFHGTADRYTLNGATSIATLYSAANVATANPAVTMRTVGTGRAVAFTYDLARSVVYTRQGNPAWSGQERDGITPIRSDDLFYGAKVGDVQPDWVDFSKIAIPQADEQQRLLWNIMLHTNSAKRPLPRFWYFPRMLKAVVVMTGDDHANGGTVGRFDQYMSLSTPGCSVADWTCIRGTSYLFPTTPIASSQVANYIAQGFELGLHVDTQCADYTAASLQTFYSTQLTQFATAFPTVPPPATNRTHCIAWSDYSSQPTVALANGIRFDTNYYYWPDQWVLDRPGMFTGSGMPMRFASSTGSMIDVYQAASQLTDESGMSYSFHADTLFNRALGVEGYYGAFTANMHTDFNPSEGQIGSDAIIASAQARGVPVIAAKQMLDWLDGRNGSSFKTITWSGNLLRFEIAVGAGATGLHTLVPATANGVQIQGITVSGAPVPFTIQTIKGVSYASFAAQSGIYQVSYGVDVIPPVITAVSATPSTSTATVQWSTNEPSDSRVEYGTEPGTLAQSAFNTAAVTAHSLALSNLQAGTTYYYRVRSTDAANNSTTSPVLGNPPASFTTAAAVLAITDATVAEGNSGTAIATFTLTLSASSSQPVTVTYATANGTATAGSDYAAASGTVTLSAGTTSALLNVTVNGDTVFEPNETFAVNLSAPVNAALAEPQATGTITNDDGVPAISIGDATITEGNTGSQQVIVPVTLSGSSSQTITVDYATASGTATVAGGDYLTASGTATFAPGVTTQSVVVPVFGDTVDEADEAFVVNLSAPVNATLADAQGTVTIADDDPQPSIAIADLSLTEGNSGTTNATFTFTLSAASSHTVTVGYATANGTATAGSDYVAGSGTATFAPGFLTTTVNVTFNGDTTLELDETLVVNLSGATNASIADAQATGTILNDEGPPALSITDVTITEGNSGNVSAILTVSLNGASPLTVTVGYATVNGTATAGSDYTAASGTVTFLPGATSQLITIPVLGDATDEPNETFAVNLSAPVNATVADPQGTVTITDDDPAPALAINDVSIAEGNAGNSNATLTVTLSSASGFTVTVGYATANGTAGGADYLAASGTLTFAPGVTSQSVTVSVSGDTIDEADETFAVNLSAPANATLADAQGTATITDDDLQPSIAIANVSMAEGNSGTTIAAFTLTLSAASGNTVTVGYATTNGTATAGSDYVAGSGTATFVAGSISTTVNVTINGDATLEFDEAFVVDLSGPTNASIADAQAAGTIVNDEGPPALSIADVAINEGNSGSVDAALTVSLSGASPYTVTVDYATANGTATAGSDYTAGSGTVTFLPGVTSQLITIAVLGDATDEPNDTLVVNLSAPVNATLADSQGTVTITDDDASPALAVNDVSIAEGNAGNSNAALTVTLSSASDFTVTVGYATANGTATVAGGDYLAASGTLTFAPGVTTQSVAVPVSGDTVDEADETFVVNLSAPANATLADAQGTGTITDDDPQPSIAIADVSLAEGNSGTTNAAFTLTLSAASGNTVTVGYATTNGTATAGSDYVAATGTATFAPGSISTTVSVTVNGDATLEADETLVVTLSGPANATLADGVAAGTIANDDGQPAVSISDAIVTEGDSGSANASLTVSLSTAGFQPVTVSYASANGTASAGSDYASASGSVTFLPGETSQSITIPVNGDTIDEANETFVVDLSAPVNATLADPQGTVTITDDDATPSIAIGDLSVAEGTSAVFAVTLSGASASTVTVSYATANGSAIAGADYTATSGVLSFAPGETSKSITIALTGDALDEADESFVINLTAPANATIADAQATGTIADDDPVPSISIADVSLTEGNSGTKLAAFTLTLSAASGRTVTVAFATTNGTATAGSDYVTATSTVSFAPGTTTATANVTINGDTTYELNETFVVGLTAPTNATIADGQATGTLTNDDALPALSITDATIVEGNTGTVTANLNVTLSAVSSQTVTVVYATANGTATAGTDYTAASGTLTFLPGSISQSVALTITGDTVSETGGETVVVNLTAPVNATIADSQGVVTISDDDAGPAPGLVAAYGFNEGSGTTTADASGAGQSGTISGGAVWTTAGKNGNALSFDGVNDMVTVADTAALDVTRVTLMAWLRPSALGDWRTAILKETSNGLAYALYANNGASRPATFINLGADDKSATGTAALALNTWTHVATTFDGSNIRLYVNGALVRTVATTGNIISSTQALRIGGNAIWNEWFAGMIDDVRIYNRALTLAEVQSMMNTAVTP